MRGREREGGKFVEEFWKWIRKPREKRDDKESRKRESACERVPDESEGKPDQEQELVEEIESFNDALQK